MKRRWLLWALLYLLGINGCGRVEPIRRYTVEKPVPKDRMLAAIVPHDDLAWFFKLSGPNQAVDELADTFSKFVGSVRMPDGEPTWTLPAGWERRPGSGMRFATIQIESADGPLELSVTSLPKMADEDRLVLDNVNRWRDQMQLPPLSADRLSAESVEMQLDAGLTATLVNLVGNQTSTGMSSAPFAAGGAPRRELPASPASRMVRKTVSYTTPDGWQAKDRVSSRGGITIERDAVFEVSEGNAQVEITVTQLPTSADALGQNINRWRSEVGLQPATDPKTEEIEVAGLSGVFVQLLGDERAILGVIVVDERLGLFIKLKGDRELATRERERFREFAESIQLSAAE